jgi:hypothetical protein
MNSLLRRMRGAGAGRIRRPKLNAALRTRRAATRTAASSRVTMRW